MTKLTRRNFALAGLGASATLGLASGAAPVSAASHAAMGAPAMFDAPLGNYKITTIFDGMVPLPKPLFFGAEQSIIDATLNTAGANGEVLPAPVNAFLLQSSDHTILIDSGVGELDALGPGFGRLTAGLAAAGVAPGDVDLVIATHAHPDHIGGLVAGGAAVFANAEVVICDVDHGFWSDAGMMAQAPEEAKGFFGLAQHVFGVYGDRLRPVAPGTEVAPGITIELAPGHTPGHSVVHIDGGDRQLMMVTDILLNTELQTAHPEIQSGFDIDPALAVETRKRIFERTSVDGVLIAATHVHFPGFGRFAKDGDAYRFVPASWM